jgi:hypothetical protein
LPRFGSSIALYGFPCRVPLVASLACLEAVKFFFGSKLLQTAETKQTRKLSFTTHISLDVPSQTPYVDELSLQIDRHPRTPVKNSAPCTIVTASAEWVNHVKACPSRDLGKSPSPGGRSSRLAAHLSVMDPKRYTRQYTVSAPVQLKLVWYGLDHCFGRAEITED